MPKLSKYSDAGHKSVDRKRCLGVGVRTFHPWVLLPHPLVVSIHVCMHT